MSGASASTLAPVLERGRIRFKRRVDGCDQDPDRVLDGAQFARLVAAFGVARLCLADQLLSFRRVRDVRRAPGQRRTAIRGTGRGSARRQHDPGHEQREHDSCPRPPCDDHGLNPPSFRTCGPRRVVADGDRTLPDRALLALSCERRQQRLTSDVAVALQRWIRRIDSRCADARLSPRRPQGFPRQRNGPATLPAQQRLGWGFGCASSWLTRLRPTSSPAICSFG